MVFKKGRQLIMALFAPKKRIVEQQEDSNTNKVEPVDFDGGVNNSHYIIEGFGNVLDLIMMICKKNAYSTTGSIYLFNVLKYLFRFNSKNGLEDLKKSQHYLSLLIDDRKEYEENE